MNDHGYSARDVDKKLLTIKALLGKQTNRVFVLWNTSDLYNIISVKSNQNQPIANTSRNEISIGSIRRWAKNSNGSKKRSVSGCTIQKMILHGG